MPLCISAYLSYALVFNGILISPPLHTEGTFFSGDCFRELSSCRIAEIGANAAFAIVKSPATAHCEPQPVKKAK
jgi:hypothetical protein